MATKNPKKNVGFFKNYVSHLAQMSADITKDINASLEVLNPNDTLETILSESPIRKGELATRIAWFTGKSLQSDRPFSDRYDVADELLGSFVMPFLQDALGLIFLGVSFYEAGLYLGIKTGVKKDDNIDHGSEALLTFGAGLIAFANSFIYSILSPINLVSRTVFTALDGYKAPENDRFYGGGEFKLGPFSYQYE